MGTIDKQRAQCPTCEDVLLERTGASAGSIGQIDKMDDPALVREEHFTCPKCGGSYLVNNQTGDVDPKGGD